MKEIKSGYVLDDLEEPVAPPVAEEDGVVTPLIIAATVILILFGG